MTDTTASAKRRRAQALRAILLTGTRDLLLSDNVRMHRALRRAGVDAELHVWEAANVIVFKRSMASGYAGVQNPLFFRENTEMLFGDAKAKVDEIVAALKAASPALSR